MLCSINNIGYAHDIPISKIHIVPDQNEVHLQLRVNSFELRLLSEVDQNHNGYIDRRELGAKRSLIKKRLLSVLRVAMDGVIIRPRSTDLMLDGHHLILRAHYPKKQNFESLKLISNIEQITSKAQITQVTYGMAGHEQKARLQGRSNTATFVARAKTSHKFNGFWASVFHYQTILLLSGIGLIIIGSMYAARKHLLANIKPEH